METIEIWRGQPTTDTDGNPIQGKPARVGTFQALVAPVSCKAAHALDTMEVLPQDGGPATVTSRMAPPDSACET